MIGKELTFLDLNDNERTEKVYFNLTRGELLKLDAVLPGGFTNFCEEVIKRQNPKEIIKFMDMLISTSFGIKTEEGLFIKPADQRDAFMVSEAYSALLEELILSDDKIQEFVKGIMPKIPTDHKKEEQKSLLQVYDGALKNDSSNSFKVVETEEERIERMVQERLAQERKALNAADKPSTE